MSNVLIGIIGVILFIGLALAGALFLGPRFQEATANSKAAAYVQAVKQVSDAVNMANIQNGTKAQVGTLSTLSPDYLKTIPNGTFFRNMSGTGSDAEVAVISSDRTPEANSETICAAVARQSGIPLVNNAAPTSARPDIGQAGCVKLTAVWNAEPIGSYIYYARI